MEDKKLAQRINAGLRMGNLAWWEMELPSGNITFDDIKTKMLGYDDPSEFTHYSDFMKLVHPDDYDSSMKAMRDHMTGKAEVYDVKYRIKTTNGSYKWFHDIGGITEKNTETGEMLIVGIVQDITATQIREEEQRLILRESNHRIKNSFASIEGLISLELDKIRESDNVDAASVLSDVLGRLKSIRTVYEQLLMSESNKELLAEEYFNSFINSITSTFSSGVSVHTDIDDIKLKVEDLFALGIITNEFVTNSLKYAFPEDGGNISFSLQRDEDDIEFHLFDDGIGMPENASDNPKGSGFGSFLLSAMCEQLRTKYEPYNDNGTHLRFKFKPRK